VSRKFDKSPLINWTAQESVQALSQWYKPPEWAFLGQVRDGTGASGSRYADAIALNVWPSRGMELHGFEVKTDRGDWLSELRNPAKSCAIQAYCDRWWLVIDRSDIAGLTEIPPTWGLILAQKDGLTFLKEAPRLTSIPFDRAFVASLLRNAAAISPEEAQREFKRGVDVGRKSAGEIGSVLDKLLRMEDDRAKLQRVITRLDTISSNLHWMAEHTKESTQDKAPISEETA
jgi:hypothetical protein